jgi:hypothetical protein
VGLAGEGNQIYHVASWLLSSEMEAPPCHEAGVIPWQTGFANVRPHGVDRARGRNANVADEGRAAIALASHSSLPGSDERARDEIQRRLILQGKPRPLARK